MEQLGTPAQGQGLVAGGREKGVGGTPLPPAWDNAVSARQRGRRPTGTHGSGVGKDLPLQLGLQREGQGVVAKLPAAVRIVARPRCVGGRVAARATPCPGFRRCKGPKLGGPSPLEAPPAHHQDYHCLVLVRLQEKQLGRTFA